MFPVNINKIYSPADSKMASQIATDVENVFKANPCGIKFSPENVHFGVLLAFSKPYEGKLTAKMWDAIHKNTEANAVYNAVVNCTPKTCNAGFSGFTEFYQYYFRFLFRMCHAKYLASTGKAKEFLIYLDDNERCRRIIRPKAGAKIAPLIKINTDIFREAKKQLE